MRRIAPLLTLTVLLIACQATPVAPAPTSARSDERDVLVATTTSTQDSGLLDVLVPLFEERTGFRVKTVAVGTGAALALGARGEADVVLVHAPEAERKWLADGNGTARVLVMHNDFVIVGPREDPAGIRGERSVVTALTKIAERGASWVSRDDGSGTDQLEKRLWRESGLDPQGKTWHLISGQGMGATLTLADQKGAYALSDRATYLARRGTLQSAILFEGARSLLNPYHVMPVDPAKFPGLPINAAGGRAFAEFLVSEEAQRLIESFGREKYGQPLFVPDAGKSEADLLG